MTIFDHNLSSPPWNSPHRAWWQSFESEIPSHLVEEPRRRQSSLPCLRKKQGIIQQKARLTQMFHKYVRLPTNGAACVQNQHFWLILEVQRELLVKSCKDMTQELSFWQKFKSCSPMLPERIRVLGTLLLSIDAFFGLSLLDWFDSWIIGDL